MRRQREVRADWKVEPVKPKVGMGKIKVPGLKPPTTKLTPINSFKTPFYYTTSGSSFLTTSISTTPPPYAKDDQNDDDDFLPF